MGFGMLFFFTNVSVVEFHVRYLALFLLFSVRFILEWFWMRRFHKNIQWMLVFLKGCILGAGVPQRVHFVLYINALPDDVICDIVIFADDTALYSKFD